MKHFIFLLILVTLVACAPDGGGKLKDDGTREPSGRRQPEGWGSAFSELKDDVTQKPSTKTTLKVKDCFFLDSLGYRYILEDTETGIEYICIHSNNGTTITPRIGKTTPKVER